MDKKGEFDFNVMTVGGIVVLFIMVVVGIALINPIFNTQSEMTTKQTVANDSLTYAATVAGDGQVNESYQMNVTKAQTGWRETGCPIEVSGVDNNNGTALVEDTDYVFSGANGNLTLLNTYKANWTVKNGNNLTLVNYTYCKEGYNQDSGSRGVAGLIGVFSVLALLGFVYWKITKG